MGFLRIGVLSFYFNQLHVSHILVQGVRICD